MPEPFTVSFFIDDLPTEKQPTVFFELLDILPELLKEHETIHFLHCDDNPTDKFTRNAVFFTRQNLSTDKERWLSVKMYPYSPEGKEKCLFDNSRGKNFYDKYMFFEGCEKGKTESAYILRNKIMTDCSDLVFFCVRKKNGLVHQTFKYAQTKKKDIITLKNSREA